jgi:hypothetical protein
MYQLNHCFLCVANSSVFMKLIRTSIALCMFAFITGIFRLFNRYRRRQKLQKYERLPEQHLQVIRRFRSGIHTDVKCTRTLPKCVTALSTLTADSIEILNISSISIKINAWVNLVAYDDRKEIAKNFFEIGDRSHNIRANEPIYSNH